GEIDHELLDHRPLWCSIAEHNRGHCRPVREPVCLRTATYVTTAIGYKSSVKRAVNIVPNGHIDQGAHAGGANRTVGRRYYADSARCAIGPGQGGSVGDR